MLRLQFYSCRLAFLLVIALGGVFSPPALRAQIAPAGIEVDSLGVLRTHVVHDRTGRLTRERLDAAKAALDPVLVRPSKLRKVSLNRLEAALAKMIARGEAPTDDMKYLVGMTRIKHVFFLPDTRDIVIAGPAEGYAHDLTGRAVGISSGRSVLELQDLITALRAFPPSGKATPVVSVSIDPTKEGLERMRQFLSNLRGITPRDAGRIASGLRESLGMQVVKVLGISPKTHFAQVLVEADYRMKLIGIGLENPPVNIKSYVQRANPRQVAGNALQRWYFTPNYECVRVSEDEFAMELVGDGVKLIGEDERVMAGGGRVRVKRSNRASEEFVREFTTKYPQLAAKSPVYAQLRNLIDMLIAAAFIQQQDYYGQAAWSASLLNDESRHQVETYEAPRHVETAVNAIWKGSTLMTPIGGGVNIQPRQALATDHLLTDKNGELADLHRRIKVEGLAKDQWWWD